MGFVEFWSVGFAEETSCLLSLVKTFDSVLSAYEGFCSLKQVSFVFRVTGCSFFSCKFFILMLRKVMSWINRD